MATGKRMRREDAEKLALEMVWHLSPAAATIQIAGSIRRGAETVGDIEIVAIPTEWGAMHDLTDGLLRAGTVTKAMYGGLPRWGDLYRGMVYEGVKVELFLATPINWGYVLWLRTGPGDANTQIMSRLKWMKSALRFHEGYGRITTYMQGREHYGSKVAVRDETMLFLMLGMRYCDPSIRGAALYERMEIEPMRAADLLRYAVAEDHPELMTGPKQRKLF